MDAGAGPKAVKIAWDGNHECEHAAAAAHVCAHGLQHQLTDSATPLCLPHPSPAQLLGICPAQEVADLHSNLTYTHLSPSPHRCCGAPRRLPPPWGRDASRARTRATQTTFELLYNRPGPAPGAAASPRPGSSPHGRRSLE
jgi:hypothetical protein